MQDLRASEQHYMLSDRRALVERGGRNAIHFYNGEMKEGGGSDTLLHLIASSLIFDPPIADARTSLQHCFIYVVGLNLTWTP